MLERKCKVCGQVKSISDFPTYKDNKGHQGRRHECRLCAKSRWQYNKRKYDVKHRYKLSKEKYDDLLIKQNNACAICLEPFTKTPYIDHDHTLDLIRGLLCNKCNIILGCAKDSPDLLHRASSYLVNFFTWYYNQVGWDKCLTKNANLQ